MNEWMKTLLLFFLGLPVPLGPTCIVDDVVVCGSKQRQRQGNVIRFREVEPTTLGGRMIPAAEHQRAAPACVLHRPDLNAGVRELWIPDRRWLEGDEPQEDLLSRSDPHRPWTAITAVLRLCTDYAPDESGGGGGGGGSGGDGVRRQTKVRST